MTLDVILIHVIYFSLSLSTLSMSSGSSIGSLGSLGSAGSSQGSQSSVALSYTDIYASQHATQVLPQVNLPELHRRVERLLQGHSTFDIPVTLGGRLPCQPLSSSQPLPSYVAPAMSMDMGPPPSYEQHIERQHRISGQSTARCAAMPDAANRAGFSYLTPSGVDGVGTASSEPDVDRIPPLSPISESSSGPNIYGGVVTRSASIAVSDESVTGSDSGVFETNALQL